MSGQNVDSIVGRNGEYRVSHEDSPPGQIPFRVRRDKIFSHVPAELVEVISPSDRRIKEDIVSVDEDELMHRMLKLRVKRYRYTDVWRRVRGIEDRTVRGVIAQEVREVFPEYITVNEEMSFDEAGFKLEDFHEVNKIRIAIDLVAAMQSRHKRFSYLPNSRNATGDVSITSGSFVSSQSTSTTLRSGQLVLRSGNGSLASGDVVLSSGSSNGTSGDILILPGAGHSHGGSVSITAGVGQVQGGSVSIVSGNTTSGPASSGSVELKSHDS